MKSSVRNLFVLVLALLVFLILTSGLLFGAFAGKLPAEAQTRILEDGFGYSEQTSDGTLNLAVMIVKSSFEGTFPIVCIVICLVLCALMFLINDRVYKSLRGASFPIAVSGAVITLTGFLVPWLYRILPEKLPRVDFEWYGAYVNGFRSSLLICGIIALAIGVVILVVGNIMKKRTKDQ